MTAAFVYGFLACVSFFLLLYFFDLIVFLLREKKFFEANVQKAEYVVRLEEKQKKAKHPQKKNYFLYLLCLAFFTAEQKEKAERLLPFLRNDPLMGIYKSQFKTEK